MPHKPLQRIGCCYVARPLQGRYPLRGNDDSPPGAGINKCRDREMAKRKRRSQSLTDRDAQNLFAKFAAPVFRAAKSPTQEKGAQRLAQLLWQALVTGPEIEAAVFQTLEAVGGVHAQDIQIIKDRYHNEMKPSITTDELRALKARYKVKKK